MSQTSAPEIEKVRALSEPLRLLLVAAEPSGDRLGRALLSSLKSMSTLPIDAFGCGGPEMERVGFRSSFPIQKLSVMGLKDVLPAIPEVFARASELSRLAVERRPHAVILIDSWGFCHQVARRLRARAPDLPIIKYVTPQVWASRPHRADVLKQEADLALTLLPFEPPYFERAGLHAEFVGNPNFELALNRGDGAGFRARHKLEQSKILIVAPGSRKSETRFLLPIFREAVRRLVAEHDDLAIVIPVSENVRTELERDGEEWGRKPLFVTSETDKFDAFAAGDAALAKSGTIATELALARTPMVMAYRVGGLTAYWARRVVRTKYASIVNVTLEKEVIPEYFQRRCAPDWLAPATGVLLRDSAARRTQLAALDRFRRHFEASRQSKPAADRAAGAVLEFLTRRGLREG